MVGKLIKTGKDYLLKDDQGETMAITSGSIQGRMLSTKNCEVIERGYDSDKLANELLYSKYPFHPSDNSGYWLDMYKEGFQKALELMGYKIFTLEDMMNCWNKALKFQDHKETFGVYIQSLQQTEWDVEVEMVKIGIGRDCYKIQPKFDDEGCIILKRK